MKDPNKLLKQYAELSGRVRRSSVSAPATEHLTRSIAEVLAYFKVRVIEQGIDEEIDEVMLAAIKTTAMIVNIQAVSLLLGEKNPQMQDVLDYTVIQAIFSGNKRLAKKMGVI